MDKPNQVKSFGLINHPGETWHQTTSVRISGKGRWELALYHKCDVGTPYTEGNSSNRFTSIPDSHAGGVNKELLPEDTQRTEED